MSESTTIRWARDEDGIVVLTLDDPNRSVNTMNAAYKVTSPQDHDARPTNETARRSGHFIALKICARGPRSRFIAVGCAFVRLSGGGRRVGRARIVVVDALGISEHEIDGGATVFFFARAYTDDRSSGAAYERGRAKISKTGNTSLFRVRTPDDGRHILFILCGTLANAKRARERVAWGGAEYDPTPDEIAAIASRFREVAEAGALNSASSWGGAGGLGLGPRRLSRADPPPSGLIGPTRF